MAAIARSRAGQKCRTGSARALTGVARNAVMMRRAHALSLRCGARARRLIAPLHAEVVTDGN
ncbi:hypothetical protein FDP22_24040 (plasmid) [Paroceanicella profunda]|uniref:Uncharacterized protein n=1 Tax=Paroceanicella profunda TaxID=2579971 RepID=A0A5B8G2V9_9RHOB|nr:hypothetical protein [Paroceanicella profunda]QDL94935.1 hypothetical protein FDP22_24040 [Paroceanicella profunda]